MCLVFQTRNITSRVASTIPSLENNTVRGEGEGGGGAGEEGEGKAEAGSLTLTKVPERQLQATERVKEYLFENLRFGQK